MTQKLHQSEKWMRLRYLKQRKSIEEIAEECGVQPMTIYRSIKQFGLKR